uniref:U6 snRNA-associated Sm-like protein LSm8 n=1 Tax=Ascaris lumbricoides TaxID=6252 RepID=A0A0M3IS05_ASCLU
MKLLYFSRGGLQAIHHIPYSYSSTMTIAEAYAMTQSLESFMNKVISVITGDGRNIVGLMKGFDQTINLVLEDSHERVFSEDAGVEQIPLGLYIVRGDNV